MARPKDLYNRDRYRNGSQKDNPNPSTRFIREPAGRYIMQPINDFTSIDEVTDITTSELNKLWRAKILLDRVTRPAELITPAESVPPSVKARTHNLRIAGQGGKSNYETDADGQLPESSISTSMNKTYREAVVHVREMEDNERVIFPPDDKTPLADRRLKYDQRFTEGLQKPVIQIFNMSSDPIVYLELQTYPEKVMFQGESTWAVINSMGRNTPMYHFTGAESVIQMNITWYCDDPTNPADVITKCKLLEAWSKGNGYISAPPILKLNWGGSELFKDELFILTAATYELSNWRGSVKQYDPKTKSLKLPIGSNTNQQYVDTNLLPAMATQELIFRRVSATNLTHADIISPELVGKTKGINKQQ